MLSLTHIIREMQTKPTLTNYFSPARLAKIQSVTTYSRQGHEEQALLNFASGYAKWHNPLWGAIWQFNQNYRCIYS